mmetsp:Transcript_20228/g.57859  ORF Transcript_20228/g.57859 Transcript_20228/m.57859 type:complete len:233 (+) Transcript_20228:577-1275(+)
MAEVRKGPGAAWGGGGCRGCTVDRGAGHADDAQDIPLCWCCVDECDVGCAAYQRDHQRGQDHPDARHHRATQRQTPTLESKVLEEPDREDEAVGHLCVDQGGLQHRQRMPHRQARSLRPRQPLSHHTRCRHRHDPQGDSVSPAFGQAQVAGQEPGGGHHQVQAVHHHTRPPQGQRRQLLHAAGHQDRPARDGDIGHQDHQAGRHKPDGGQARHISTGVVISHRQEGGRQRAR